MFEGKIRKCLKCGSRGRYWLDFGGLYGCSNNNCKENDSVCGLPEYQAANQWNIKNTPPEDLVYLRQYYARFNMELPC